MSTNSNDNHSQRRRNPPRNSVTSSSSSNSLSSSPSSNKTNGKPTARSSRLKNHHNLYNEGSDDESGEDVLKINPTTNNKLTNSTSLNKISADSKINISNNLNNKSKMVKSSSLSNGSSSSAAGTASRIDMDKLAKLETITGLSRGEAIELLELSENKLEKAVELHFGNDHLKTNKKDSKLPNGSTNGKLISNPNKRGYSKLNNDDDNSNDPISVDDSNDTDDVRAPIPQKIEKLLDYDPYALAMPPQTKRMRSAFDGYKNEDELFNGNTSSKAKTLSSMFRPPIDLIFNGSFEASKIQGCKVNKWVIVNVQDAEDFSCQCLNRDVWRDDTVKEIIKANFVFFQTFHDSIDGRKLINYYRIDAYPYVAILDPRTGEKLMQFNRAKIDQFMFCEKVTGFLADYDSPIKDFVSESDSNSKTDIIKVDDEDDVVVVNNVNKNGLVNGNHNTNSKLYPSCSVTPKKSITNGTSKPQKGVDVLKSIIKEEDKRIINVDNEDEDDDIEIEDDNDKYATSKDKNKPNKKQDTITNGKIKKQLDENNSDVEVDDKDDDEDFVISKDKYNKEKLKKLQSKKNKLDSSSSSASPSTSPNTSFSKSKLENILSNTHITSQTSQTRYEVPDCEKRDCILRILYPTGTRLDYCTNGDFKLKTLIDYLKQQGYKKKSHEIIERLMPNIITTADVNNPATVTNQSRNLFNSNLESSFKELNLYPRVFLLLQES